MAATKKTTAKKKTALSQASISSMKNNEELQTALLTAQSELVEAKRSHAARELANTRRLKELRIQIARIKTALNKLTKETRNASTKHSVKEKA